MKKVIANDNYERVLVCDTLCLISFLKKDDDYYFKFYQGSGMVFNKHPRFLQDFVSIKKEDIEGIIKVCEKEIDKYSINLGKCELVYFGNGRLDKTGSFYLFKAKGCSKWCFGNIHVDTISIKSALKNLIGFGKEKQQGRKENSTTVISYNFPRCCNSFFVIDDNDSNIVRFTWHEEGTPSLNINFFQGCDKKRHKTIREYSLFTDASINKYEISNIIRWYENGEKSFCLNFERRWDWDLFMYSGRVFSADFHRNDNGAMSCTFWGYRYFLFYKKPIVEVSYSYDVGELVENFKIILGLKKDIPKTTIANKNNVKSNKTAKKSTKNNPIKLAPKDVSVQTKNIDKIPQAVENETIEQKVDNVNKTTKNQLQTNKTITSTVKKDNKPTRQLIDGVILSSIKPDYSACSIEALVGLFYEKFKIFLTSRNLIELNELSILNMELGERLNQLPTSQNDKYSKIQSVLKEYKELERLCCLKMMTIYHSDIADTATRISQLLNQFINDI